MANINYSTPEQQILKLKHQSLIINDEDFAIEQLQTYGYFNLIKSYRDPYTIKVDGNIVYRSGVTFEQIYSLYVLDKNLRNAVINSMLDLEEHLKAVTSDVLAQSFGVTPESYLKFRNFRDKKKSKSRFSLSGILKSLNQTLATAKDPICHYRENHGAVPPWILMKSVYFSTVVNFINLFKPNEQSMIANILYPDEITQIDDSELRSFMLDTLFICLEYRNLAAHGGRTYNYICNSSFRQPPSLKILHGPNEVRGFSQLVLLLSAFKYDGPYDHLLNVLNKEVDRHCRQYPEDITYLATILNVNIIPNE